MAAARQQSSERGFDAPRAPEHEHDDFDLVDVPAAIVELLPPEELTQRSGVVAIVPWERPGPGYWSRLWSTARLVTTGAESFFHRFPNGDVMAALRFAIAAELTAITGLLLMWTGLGVLIAPDLARAVWADDALRSLALRGAVAGIPTLATGMILLHVVHALALDRFARKHHARARQDHALRFGLYACGWDLVSLPLGLLVLAITDGPRAALSAIGSGFSVPGRASSAFLHGIYQLEADQAEAVQRRSILVTSLFLTLCLCLVGVTLVLPRL